MKVLCLTCIYESLVKTRVYARKKRTMILLVPAFLGLEILWIERRREEGPKVSNVSRWRIPSLFRRAEVKIFQGTHQDFEWLCRKEKRCWIGHGHILKGLKEKLESSVGLRPGK